MKGPFLLQISIACPGDHPERDSSLEADELITAIDLPPQGFAEHFTYLKVRDRASYAFALVSVAVGLEMQADTITAARVALGGVAHKPWRDEQAEGMLIGKTATTENFTPVADLILRDARGFGHNTFKTQDGKTRHRSGAAGSQWKGSAMIGIPTIADPLRSAGLLVGRGVSRVDGRLKVTGAAKYAAEHSVTGMLYGVVVSGAITKGENQQDQRLGGLGGARGGACLHA